jgi:hypothetical protein
MKTRRTNPLLFCVPQNDMQYQEWHGSAKVIVSVVQVAWAVIELLLALLEIATLF